MAGISQYTYELCMDKKRVKYPPMSRLLYGIVFVSLFLSFFSNKFYENIFSTATLKELVTWFCCYMFFCRLEYDKKKKRLIVKK